MVCKPYIINSIGLPVCKMIKPQTRLTLVVVFFCFDSCCNQSQVAAVVFDNKSLISEDTYKGSLWEPQSQNGYGYVWNNPLIYTDPSGHDKQYQIPSHDMSWYQNFYKDYDYWVQQANALVSSSNIISQYSGLDKLLTPTAREQLGQLYMGYQVGDKYTKLGMEIQALALRNNACSYVDCSVGEASFGEKNGDYFTINYKVDDEEDPYGFTLTQGGLVLCHCFTAGTTVLTSDGEKPIEDIKVGDKVLAKNDKTGEVSYQPVEWLFHCGQSGHYHNG